jgi:hypothetical protein
MKPWMQNDQIELIERILTSFKKIRIDILEWGSGGSTVYFTRFLKNSNIKYKWLSIEHHKGWHKRISKLLKYDDNVKFLLFPESLNDPRSINFDQYVTAPRLQGKKIGFSKFDFILIDGRARARCLVEARFLIKPGGIILLHDAEREKYHYAFGYFDNGKMIKSDNSQSAVWITGDFERLTG